MDPRQTRKRSCSTNQVHDRNTKRREMYENMSLAKKNALLLQRSLKKTAVTTKRLLANTNNENSIEPTSVNQGNLVIGASSSVLQTENLPVANIQCAAFACANVLDKGENVVYPFCIFEKGSTSGTSNEPYARAFETNITEGPQSHSEDRCAKKQLSGME